jgi:hypothetical protein
VTPHTGVLIKQFLTKQGIPELNHDPYSHDLCPRYFFLFPKIRSTLKGRFEDIVVIKKKCKKGIVDITCK